MKEKAATYSGPNGGGRTEVSTKILAELYERLLYKEVVLEVMVSYTSGI